jgi:hypothetical protein
MTDNQTVTSGFDFHLTGIAYSAGLTRGDFWMFVDSFSYNFTLARFVPCGKGA